MGVGWCHFLSVCPSPLSQICKSPSGCECDWIWTLIGPSRLRPFLTPDPSSEEEVGNEGRCSLNQMSLVMSLLQTDSGVVVSTGQKMGDQGRQVEKCRRKIREMVKTQLGRWCCRAGAQWQDIGISMDTGFRIIANVNSHQFLPKWSPLSLQQDFPRQLSTKIFY